MSDPLVTECFHCGTIGEFGQHSLIDCRNALMRRCDEAYQLIQRLQQAMWTLSNSPLTSDDSKHYLSKWDRDVKQWLDERYPDR